MNHRYPNAAERGYLNLFAVTMVLVACGVMAVYSSSYPRAAETFARQRALQVQRGERLELPAAEAIDAAVLAQQRYVRMQLQWAAVGLLCLVVCFYLPQRWLRSAAVAISLLVLSALLLLAVKFMGSSRGGAARWLVVGPVVIQPSEIAKISLLIYLAARLAALGPRIRELRYFTGVMGVTGTIAVLILIEPHLGATLVLMATVVALLLVAGARPAHLLVVLVAGSLLVLSSVSFHGYQQGRLRAWLHPEQDARLGYQAVHCGTALARGGLAGRGVGRSIEKFGYLPECHTDSVLAVIGEETGFVGSFGLLLLFGMFAWRGLAIAETCADPFGRLLAVGLTTLIFFQALFNFGVTTGLLPQTGVGLPFISYGGSSLCCFLGAVGLIMNVSRDCVPRPSRFELRRQATGKGGVSYG